MLFCQCRAFMTCYFIITLINKYSFPHRYRLYNYPHFHSFIRFFFFIFLHFFMVESLHFVCYPPFRNFYLFGEISFILLIQALLSLLSLGSLNTPRKSSFFIIRGCFSITLGIYISLFFFLFMFVYTFSSACSFSAWVVRIKKIKTILCK